MKVKHKQINNTLCDYTTCTNIAEHIVAIYESDEYPYDYRLILSCDEHVEALQDANDAEYWVSCPVCGVEFGV